MFELNIWQIEKGCYFSLNKEGATYETSACISELFNINIDDYNKILIEKVIQHNLYFTNIATSQKGDDIVFKLNDISKEVYIERFKNTFNKELTLLILGGI